MMVVLKVHPQVSISGHSQIPDCIRDFSLTEHLHHCGEKLDWSSSLTPAGEIIPLVVLVTDELEEENLGMVTTFCHHDQAKVEPSEVLSTLLQQDCPRLSVVVVKIFTNSPYIPHGSFSFPYLDVTTLAVGMFAAQFPLAWLWLYRLLPFSSTQVVLPCERDDRELKVYPFLQEALWESSKEDHHLSDHILLLVPPSSFSPHHEESSQTKEDPSLSPTLTWLQHITQAKAQLK